MEARDAGREFRSLARSLARTLLFIYVPLMLLAIVLAAFQYPHDTDGHVSSMSAHFYESAYIARSVKRGFDYEMVSKFAADELRIEPRLRAFVADHKLEHGKALEVGSGRGYLQDVVEDYTGLDISPSVAKNYHKPFVVASATKMPFADSSFDAVWTVWVLEHISEPELALREMRRVLKPGGILYLHPAWNCAPWAADGFAVRPYSEFNWRGKLVKASIPIRDQAVFQLFYQLPIRAMRRLEYAAHGPAEHLRFRALSPNYETYWQLDADAAISLDSYETYLWFREQGDRCLNCPESGEQIYVMGEPLVLQIHKP